MLGREATEDLRVADLWTFFAIAFGISWGLVLLLIAFPETVVRITGPVRIANPLFLLAVYAPAIAGVALVLRRGGGAGLRSFLARLLLWRAGRWWWAFLLLGVPAIFWAAALLAGDPTQPRFPSLGAALAAVALMGVIGPVEEIGWRGVALPLLQRRMAPLAAGLVLGAIWGVWHLPAFFLAGAPQDGWPILPFMAASVAVSVIVTALFNAAGGSILLPALLHWQLNNPLWPDAQPWDAPLFVAAAGLVVWLDRKALLSRAGAAAEVIPPSGRTRTATEAPVEPRPPRR